MRYSVLPRTSTLDNDFNTYNFFTVNWRDFNFSDQPTAFEVTERIVNRPYLLSIDFYGIPEYLDLLLLINNIPNVFDLYVGQVILIPAIEDLNFILNTGGLS